MRFSIRWLKNYLQTDLPAQTIIDALTDCGLEVEEVLDLGMLSGKLVTGEILAIDPIEGADKIRVCTVQADGPKPLRIVCGAWNIEVGHKVPVAHFGMKFPGGFELKPRKIMGISGDGMLCSQKELGVSEEGAGIWLLPDDLPVGEPYDAVVEISITPNRPDALSIVGVARDLAARLAVLHPDNKPVFKLPALQVPEGADKAESAARVSIEAREDCPRYTARVVRDVKVAPSPRWMQAVLESAGMRPINNLVDITNFVMLELGHPLHAFDLDRLKGRQIVVRNARKGEKIVTLDEQELRLEESDLLICDAEDPVALAGIMGGANSEIGDETQNVLLEAAYFRPQTIRRTSRRLDKSTDSSYRFERGMDPKKLTAALNRAAQLMASLAGGTVLRGHIDAVGRVPEKEPITLRLERLNEALGVELSGRQVTDVLTPLGFEVQRSDREEIQLAIPSHRVDVSLEADIVEEVARIYGYDRIPERRVKLPSAYHAPAPLDRVRQKLADAAVALGFHQAVNFSFVSEKENGLTGAADSGQVRLLNPITADQTVMRRSLLSSLLRNVAHNLNQSVEEIPLFELGHTYVFPPEEEADTDPRGLTPPANETPYFAAVLCGAARANWREPVREPDFFRIKGYAEEFLSLLGMSKLVVEAVTDVPWLHPGRAARFLAKGQPVALFGELHPAVLKEMDIRRRTVYLEIPLTGPALEETPVEKYKEIPRYPAVTRDVALLVDRDVRSMDLERTIRKAGKDLLASVRLFDVYEGDKVEKGKRSLAYSLTYRSPDRTLTEAEVTERHGEVLQALEKNHSARPRT